MTATATPAVTSRSRRQRNLNKARKNGTDTTEQTMAAYGTKRKRLLADWLNTRNV